jgi:AAA domain
MSAATRSEVDERAAELAAEQARQHFEDAVAEAAFAVRVRAEAQRRVAAECAVRQPFDAALLADVVIEPVRWRVEGLLPAQGRLLVAAQRKAGKTTFTLNLARNLLLGGDHLGHFHVQPIAGRVGFLNFEVSRSQLCLWAREVGVPGDRFFAVHLRGRANPFADADDTARLAALLRAATVEAVIVDPFGRAYTGTSQNDAGEVGAFLSGLDRFAEAAGCSELVLTAHAGWDGERTRGSSALEDWADAVAYLVRDKENDRLRYFRAIGRDVEVDEDRLNFDPTRRRLTLAGAGSRAAVRTQIRTDEILVAVVEAVTREPGANSGRLQVLLRDAGLGLHRGEGGKAARKAADAGLIVRVPGPRGSYLHFPKDRNTGQSAVVPTSPQVVPGDYVTSPHHPIRVGGLVTSRVEAPVVPERPDREPGDDDEPLLDGGL